MGKDEVVTEKLCNARMDAMDSKLDVVTKKQDKGFWLALTILAGVVVSVVVEVINVGGGG